YVLVFYSHISSTIVFFFFLLSCDLRYLHSFPTRRSSDLGHAGAVPGDVVGRRPGTRLSLGRPAGDAFLGPLPGVRNEVRHLGDIDRKSTRLNSSHVSISYAVFCLKKKKKIRSIRKTIRLS